MFQNLTESKIQYSTSTIDLASKWLRQRLFSISPEEATFARRGFQSSDAKAQQQLEQIGRTFLQGYHAAIALKAAPKAIASDQSEVLIIQLNTIAPEWRGFAFEGAAMGLALLDILTPWKQNRVQMFLAGAGAEHIYMVYVGMGWALARIPFAIDWYKAQLNPTTGITKTVSNRLHSWKPNLKSKIQNSKSLDPLLGWLAIDGYGFHQGYFYASRYVDEKALPKRLSGYALRVFDQGLGRSLWFVGGADVTRIRHILLHFHPTRRADLWSGIGLACAYAGGVDRNAIALLKIAAGDYQIQLAQGAAFAAKARQRAGNSTAHTEMACEVLCGMSADAAAEITDIALAETTKPDISRLADAQTPAYEVWRLRIQVQLGLLGITA